MEGEIERERDGERERDSKGERERESQVDGYDMEVRKREGS